jgi:hypothetical protein
MALTEARSPAVARQASRLSVASGPTPWLIGVGGVVALGLVLLAHGALPGYINDQSTAYLTEGAIKCEHGLGLHMAITRCHAYGNPLGYPLLINVPVIILGAVLMWLPGVGAGTAYWLSLAIFDAVALAGGYGLGRRIGAGRALALWSAFVYLVSPTVIGMRAFPGTFSGYALLPIYALADLFLFDELVRPRSRRMALVVAAYAALRAFVLFMDGYSFVLSAVVSGCLWIAWSWRRGRGRRAWLPAAVLVAANVFAYVLYNINSPGAFPDNDLALLRSMGLDMVSLVKPTMYVWFAHIGGFSWNATGLWGDGTNVTYNYIGFVSVALAVLALWRTRERYALAFAAAGLLALVLSLGPALKVDSRDLTPSGRPGTLTPYLMPANQATAELPWDHLFTALPGIKSMRATYRWFGLTRLSLILLAALGIERLARRKHLRWRALAVIAAVAATFELLPNYSFLLGYYRSNARQMDQATRVLGGELRALTKPGERVFFLNYDGTHNDFIVNYLAPFANLRAYNAGGDKDALFAEMHWPADVFKLAGARVAPAVVYDALKEGNLDAVILPYFHLRWTAYQWPPLAQDQSLAHRAFAPLLRDPRLRVEQRGWLATVRLAQP